MSVGESLHWSRLVSCEPCNSPLILDFSNILSKTAIERLAEVDEYEVVKEVQVRFVPSVLIYAPTNGILGILCGLRTVVTVLILLEPHTDYDNASIWVNTEFLGSEGARTFCRRNHCCFAQS